MKRLHILALVFALAALLSVFAVSATIDLPITVDQVEVDGEELVPLPGGVNRLSFERGNEIEVKVKITGQTTLPSGGIEDVEIEAFIAGFEHNNVNRISDTTPVFTVKANDTYVKRLRLEVPDLAEEDEYLLRVIVADRNSNPVVKNYRLAVDLPRHDIKIRDVVFNPENTIQAGRALLATVRLKNIGERDEDDGIKVTVEIPDLDVSASDFIDELESEESTTSEELFLRIPACAPAGSYTAKVTAEFNDGFDTVSTTKAINVIESGTCELAAASGRITITVSGGSQQLAAGGAGAAYPVTISNGGGTDRTFTLSVEGVSDWGSVRVTPSNVVSVDSGDTETAFVFVSASQGAAAGEHTFVVSVKGASGETLRDIALKADVTGAGAGSDTRRALEIGLLVLVVVLVIAGLAVALRRKGKEGEESQTYY